MIGKTLVGVNVVDFNLIFKVMPWKIMFLFLNQR